mmetsp:Transcript_14036/g.47501  ORF Transcript_14036/g.47501 Transcript_14036/m.47501 type:complete len:346 (-) Transcript_14036:53-1090(-)
MLQAFGVDDSLWRRFQQAATTVAMLLVVMWTVEFLNIVSGQHLSDYGIRPRTLRGLAGIPLAPFLHSGIEHIVTTSLAFAVLSALTILRHGLDRFLRTSAWVVLLAGLAVWIVGRGDRVHVGASGWVYGLLGYLLAMGFSHVSVEGFPPRKVHFAPSALHDIAIAAAVLVVYSSLLLGAAVPHETAQGTWEYHAACLIVGVTLGAAQVASLLDGEDDESESSDEDEDGDSDLEKGPARPRVYPDARSEWQALVDATDVAPMPVFTFGLPPGSAGQAPLPEVEWASLVARSEGAHNPFLSPRSERSDQQSARRARGRGRPSRGGADVAAGAGGRDSAQQRLSSSRR